MAKFCVKCGKKLDKVTQLCPNCYKKEIKIQKKNLKKEKKELKHKSKPNKVKSFFLKILLLLVILSVLICGIIGTLSYFNIINIPTVSNIVDTITRANSAKSVERDLPETDTSGFEYYAFSEDSIRTDGGKTFVDDEILVSLTSTLYETELEDYVSSIGGKIVGYIEVVADYQILLDDHHSQEELNEIIKELNEFDWVQSASLNLLIKLDTSYIPNDSKWKYEWDDTPSGKNWGVEAINAPDAWEYKDQFSEVNIGVFDITFDIYHEDLEFAEEPLGNETALSNKNLAWDNHGTHVAGTIAAKFDNKKGISGISPKTNLYGVSLKGLETSGHYSFQAFKVALNYLIVTKKCSVVNISLGYNQISFSASRQVQYSLDVLEYWNTEIGGFLKELIDKNYSFVICKSAGNLDDEENEGNLYFRKDTDDPNNDSEYYSYADFIKFTKKDKKIMKNKTLVEQFQRYKNRKKEIKERAEGGNVDVKYDIFGAITDEDVKSRIIMVGSIQNKSKKKGFFKKENKIDYKIPAYSQRGSRLDVLAPGDDIYSTIKGGYGNDTGTSMASPHVAGVAGLIYSLNPNIDGSTVKDIIVNTATGNYGQSEDGQKTYRLLNAKKAVEETIENMNDTNSTIESKIPNDAAQFNGHYYAVYQFDNITTWEEAQEYCESLGGYLATITSKDEDKFLYSYLSKNYSFEQAYFGLYGQNSEDWFWGNEEALSYTNWHSQEPLSKYGTYKQSYLDGSWSSGNGTAENGILFICEWGSYQKDQNNTLINDPTTSEERDIVLVLDTSGSMSGSPLNETKKASGKFVNTILKKDASIGIVTYSQRAERQANFSMDPYYLIGQIESCNAVGGTNISSGLEEAEAMLEQSNAKKKIIVLMSDGSPNAGKEGDDLISYAEQLKEEDIIIYTLGFFDSLGGEKTSAQQLMEGIASEGCHYEVSNADDLEFFFDDMADQINGQKYIYIRIACPVEVSVTYDGETLNSSQESQILRTDFGTLSFENNENETSNQEDDLIKILRLKEGADYDIRITGTSRGSMDYTIAFSDDEGEYTDFRRFENIDITRRTVIDTVATVSNESILKIDEDGDGKYDKKIRATENGYGEEVKTPIWLYAIIATTIIILFTVCIKLHSRRKRNKFYH